MPRVICASCGKDYEIVFRHSPKPIESLLCRWCNHRSLGLAVYDTGGGYWRARRSDDGPDLDTIEIDGRAMGMVERTTLRDVVALCRRRAGQWITEQDVRGLYGAGVMPVVYSAWGRLVGSRGFERAGLEVHAEHGAVQLRWVPIAVQKELGL